MTKTENIKKAQRKASMPEARAKAAATMRRRNAEKKALLAAASKDALLAAYSMDETPMMHSIGLDAIPDREPKQKKKYVYPKKRGEYMVTEKEWMFLKMAKMLLNGGE